MSTHCFLEESQYGLLVPFLRDEALQHLALVIDSPPEVMPLTVDLHEHRVQVPLPAAQSYPIDTAFADLGGEHRAKPVPPKPHRLVANVGAALVEQIFHISQRKREPNVHHHRQADDLGTGLEIAERGAFRHALTTVRTLRALKKSTSDRTQTSRDRCAGWLAVETRLGPNLLWHHAVRHVTDERH